MSKYRAAIIGCGGVGGLADSPGDKNIISHAYAYSRHDSFKLIAGCDTNQTNLEIFKNKCGEKITLYNNIDDLTKNNSFDIVSVCTSTETHADIINKLLALDYIKLIICEKPIVATADQLSNLKERFRQFPNNKLLINFSRRYDPGFITLGKRIKDNEFGAPLSFNGLFVKGLYHNGCHMFELLEHLLGDIKTTTAINCQVKQDDIYGLFSVETSNCIGVMTNFEPENYSIFELDVTFEKGRIRITESGHKIEIHKPAKSKVYDGYTEIYENETIPDSFYKRMYHTMEAARNYLEEDSINGRGIFDCHFRLSEKMLILKEQFISGLKTVTF